MAFFGLTTLGASDPMHEGTKLSQAYGFHEIPYEAYVEVFNQNVIGDSDVSVTLEVDGQTHILRARLGDMLKQLLQRQPRKFELDAWFTHFDYERTPLMGVDEYMRGVDSIVAFSASGLAPVTYSSYDTQRADWLRHARVGYESCQTYKSPLTTAQDIGWHAGKALPPGAEARKVLGSTDVTRKEGRTAQHYYGYF